jgi:predicted double-glycine peptidase
MIEAERIQRNQSRLQELYPYFRIRVQAVLQEMEAAGYRPRIQDAWRSPADQLKAYQQGTSQVQFGFHNVTGANGMKEALAADILDDNHISGTKTDYMLQLAAAAQRNGLTTGIRWGLSDTYSKAVDDAIAAQTWTVPIHVGWDPLHVEATGITIPEAKRGLRPDTKDSGNSGGTPDPVPDAPKRKFKVEEIGTDCVVEYSLGSTLRPVTLLPVPYVSQLGTGADGHSNDCGAASAIMLLRAYQKSSMTPDEFYSQFNISGDPFLSVTQIQSAMNRMGLLTQFRAGLSIPDLFNLIASSKPAIVLIRYKVLFEAGLTEKSFQGPHFAVVVGLDPKYIYLHDPLYTDPLVGEAHAYPIDKFWQAWKEVAADPTYPNPERSAIIPTAGLGFQVSRKAKVNIPSLNVRTGPGFNNPQIGTVKKGDIFAISREMNGWGEIGFNQWIKLSYTVDV